MAKGATSIAGEQSNFPGMGLAGASFMLQTAADTLFKMLAGGGHPAYQILFVNSFFALIPIFLWAGLTGGLGQLASHRLPQHLARGTAGALSSFAAVFAYARLPLADYYAIVFAAPLLVTFLSAFWLGEPIGKGRGIALACGLVGVLIVANPFSAPPQSPWHEVTLGRFSAFISVFCYALSVIMIRRMRTRESSLSFPFYGYVACIVICGACLWLKGGPGLNAADYTRLAFAGLLFGTSSICLLTAYHRTPVVLVAPFQYTQIIWGALAGYIFWAQLPGLRLVTGAAIVAASGFAVIYGELRSRRPALAAKRLS